MLNSVTALTSLNGTLNPVLCTNITVSKVLQDENLQ